MWFILSTLWKLAMGTLFLSSTTLTLSVSSWFGVWVGMEMMILTLMPLMVSTTNSAGMQVLYCLWMADDH